MLKRALGGALIIFVFTGLSAGAAFGGLVTFHSPSDNIGCVLTARGVRCDIAEHRWTPPPEPKSCDLDWGGGVALDSKGRADWVCAGDTTLHQGNALAYGETVKRGRFKCKSKESGMRCVDTDDKHGFFLSRDTVRLF
jgi:hypothetical protein